MIRTTHPTDYRIASAPRELDSRLSDGIHVRLLWFPEDGHRVENWCSVDRLESADLDPRVE
jgi:hypothetical protein